MEISKSIAVMKALSDTSRVRIVKALAEKPCYGEELANRLGLAESTVSFHLKKLQAVGLVSSVKEQYYIVYALNPQIFQLTLHEIISAEDNEQKTQSKRLEAYREKTLRTFFKNGKLAALPVQHKKKLVILHEFRKLFAIGREYSEKEVTAVITPSYGDYCTIRRLMIEEGWMTRINGIYTINEEKERHE